MCTKSHDERRSTHEIDKTVLHEVKYDDGPITETVVEAIAEVSDDPPTEMKPLYESVSPDALRDLFDRPSHANVPSRVEFRHHGYAIVIERDGRVAICDPN
ncbi:HalOD1 output domain-containing protein [Haladaptatus pallidirubidus]|uniref:Halobacterial output domain-containing protein n=1 Tax=Haladaptatus pallidirubidus TaxID=1008152 RepID=A0AAV3UD52_9EURY|nr:HalOD1 output domain-containing protein [Haladaptatus pallidirubidus]